MEHIPNCQELTISQQQSAFLVLWFTSEDGNANGKKIEELIQLFSIDRSTIRRLWYATNKKNQNCLNNNDGLVNHIEKNNLVNKLLRSPEFFKSGATERDWKWKWDRAALTNEVKQVPLKKG